MSNRPLQILLLGLAVLPTGIIAGGAVYLMVHGEATTLNWQTKIWSIVGLQLVSIAAFWLHAGQNKYLAPGELGHWIFQFIMYIPFGMVSYWRQYVWGRSSGLRL